MEFNQKKLAVFNKLKIEVKKFFLSHKEKFNQGDLELKIKDDQSKVTFFDLEISKLIIQVIRSEFPEICIYSEEHHENLNFPSFIIDPIDGTKEFSKGIPECSVSIAFMEDNKIDNKNNYGWIYNPFTGFEIESGQNYLNSKGIKKDKYIGYVSNTEWKNNIHENLKNHKKITLAPKGSIAFKLGLLAAGGCDLVVSKYPKNIWDIAAGIIINSQNGVNFYINKIKQSQIKVKYLGNEEMLWMKEDFLMDSQI